MYCLMYSFADVHTEIAEAERADFVESLARAPALVLHTVDSDENAGAMQAGPAMDQHGINVRVVHQLEKLVDHLRRQCGSFLRTRSGVKWR